MSQRPVPPDPALSEWESALRGLAPAPSRLDRDALMYRAGRGDRGPAVGRNFWPLAAGVLALVALGEGALLAGRPPTRVVERLVVIREPAPAVDLQPVPEPARPPEPRPVDRPTAVAALGVPGFLPPFGDWPAVTRANTLRDRLIRDGLDGLPDLPPLAVSSDGDPDRSPASSGALLRAEVRRLLNPGEPS